jgi:catechol 2,3-dioxygenase-like lactoylglutathione lyase family enzyme
MAAELDHLIVASHDRDAAAAFLADVLGLPVGDEHGPFRPVRTASLALDFMQADGDVESQHYAFRVTEDDFDGIRDRLTARGATYYADPRHREADAINHENGGRGLYFTDLSGHRMEILTRP